MKYRYLSVSYQYLRYFLPESILLYLPDTRQMYLEYLTEDTFQSIFPNPDARTYDLNIILSLSIFVIFILY